MERKIKSIKTRLRKVRLERKIPLWKLAGIAGIACETLYNVETLRQHAGTVVREALSKALNLPESKLFGNDGYALGVE